MAGDTYTQAKCQCHPWLKMVNFAITMTVLSTILGQTMVNHVINHVQPQLPMINWLTAVSTLKLSNILADVTLN